MTTKAILFDFDGTLANTLPLCFEAFQTVFREFDQVSLSNEEIKQMFGPSETEMIQIYLKHPDKLQAIERFYQVYEEEHHRYVASIPGIHQLLDELVGSGIKVGIVTGKAQRSLDISLKLLEIESNFDVVITGDDVTNAKPHPEGVIKALKKMNISTKEAMFIGDSDADIIAGKEANVTTIGVHWVEEFQTAYFDISPDHYFTKIKTFQDYLYERRITL